jgi:hypothetical protein
VQVIPLTPVIDQVPVPVGVAPLAGPATVAVKVKVEPSATLEAEVVTLTVGVIWLMVIEAAALGPLVV